MGRLIGPGIAGIVSHMVAENVCGVAYAFPILRRVV